MEDGKGGKGRGGIVRPAGESVGFAVTGPFLVDDGVLVGSKGSCPSGMAFGCSSSCREVFQVFVICVDADRVGSSLYIDTPLFERCHDCQKFFIVYWVIELGWCELARVEADKVEVALRRRLRQDVAQGEVRGIGLDSEGELRLEVLQNRGCSEGLLLGPLPIVTSAPLVSVPNSHLCASRL